MSTKIYNGLQLLDVGTTKKLLDFQQNLREQAIPVLRREVKRIYFQTLVHAAMVREGIEADNGVISDLSKYKDTDVDKLRLSLYYDFKQQMKKLSKSDDMDAYDYVLTLSLGVFPIGRKVLAIPFACNDKLLEVVDEHPQVQEYGYWNNCDRPETVTARQWNQRGKDWDEALPGIGVPSECGMIIPIVDGHDYQCNIYDMSDIPAEKILIETVRVAVKRSIVDKKAEEYMAAHPGEKLTMSTLLNLDQSVTTKEIDKGSMELIYKVGEFLKTTGK